MMTQLTDVYLPWAPGLNELTNWGRDKMAAISQTTFWYIFSLIKILEFRLKFHWKFVPRGPINNILPLVQIMAWRRPGDKPLSEPMMVRLLRHLCVTRPQWVKPFRCSPFSNFAIAVMIMAADVQNVMLLDHQQTQGWLHSERCFHFCQSEFLQPWLQWPRSDVIWNSINQVKLLDEFQFHPGRVLPVCWVLVMLCHFDPLCPCAFSMLLALCEGNPPVTRWFPSQRSVTQSFHVMFSLNKQLSK